MSCHQPSKRKQVPITEPWLARARAIQRKGPGKVPSLAAVLARAVVVGLEVLDRDGLDLAERPRVTT